MGRIGLEATVEQYRLSAPFRISGFLFEESPVLKVTVTDGELQGQGEASGVYYTGDDVDHMVRELEEHRTAIESGVGREELRGIMPIGGARNAVDAALWELDSLRAGRPVWELAGVPAPRPLVTTFTLGADSPQAMAEGARRYAQARAIKVKLTGDLDLDKDRVRAIRAARPDVWLGVDANQGFAIGDLDRLMEVLLEANVSLLEQPLRRGAEAHLEGYSSPIPIAADESMLGLADVPSLVGRFQVANIKLDKCGGLTEGLLIAEEARRLGLDVMVGNMIGTSLAMAPAFVLGQLCDIVDLDAPIFLVKDREPSIVYEEGSVWCSEEVWGARAGVRA